MKPTGGDRISVAVRICEASKWLCNLGVSCFSYATAVAAAVAVDVVMVPVMRVCLHQHIKAARLAAPFAAGCILTSLVL